MLDVLIVDDEVLVALDLAQQVEGHGLKVIGPAFSLEEAEHIVKDARPGLALLDIDVNGQKVWPLAASLIERGWTVTFISADPHHPELKSHFAACRFINKPISDADVAAETKQLLSS